MREFNHGSKPYIEVSVRKEGEVNLCIMVPEENSSATMIGHNISFKEAAVDQLMDTLRLARDHKSTDYVGISFEVKIAGI